MSRRGLEGDTLPNALAALARARERTLAEVDENLAAKKRDAERSQGSDEERVAFR